MSSKATKILNNKWEEILQSKEEGLSLSDISMLYGVSVKAIKRKLSKDVYVTTAANPSLNILLLDIENAPMLSYHWGVWKQNIGEPMRLDGNRSYMMSIAMKWLGDSKVHYFETRTEDDSELVKSVIPFLDKADIIIAHNGKSFDIKKINAYAIMNNIKPPSPFRQIDTLIEARKHFMFERNTLAYIAKALGCSDKLDHAEFQGFTLWEQCMKGNEKAWQEMKKYNIQDVQTLEEVYLKMRPFIKSHPNVVTGSGSEKHRCTTCGSPNLIEFGYATTNVSKFRQYKCQACGSFSRSRKNMLEKEHRDKLLTSIA